jgi:crotonobetaine/carnitine-CoA ligase
MRVVDPETDEELPRGEIGEFVVRLAKPWTTMQGYVGMPEKRTEAWRNLWFHTGDAGYVDASGYFYFVDRLGDRIRRRAENISSMISSQR